MSSIKLIYSTIFLGLTIFLFSFSLDNIQKQKQANGKILFDKYCASCHHPTKTMTGAPFPFIRQKNGNEWVYKIVNNNGKLQRENVKARLVFRNKTQMPIYEGLLTNKEIDEICDYVDGFYKTK